MNKPALARRNARKREKSRTEFDTQIGAAIKKARKYHGLTQAELGRKVGYTREAISSMENGAVGIFLHTFWEIKKCLPSL